MVSTLCYSSCTMECVVEPKQESPPKGAGPKVTLHNARSISSRGLLGEILKKRDIIMYIYTMQVVDAHQSYHRLMLGCQSPSYQKIRQ